MKSNSNKSMNILQVTTNSQKGHVLQGGQEKWGVEAKASSRQYFRVRAEKQLSVIARSQQGQLTTFPCTQVVGL